MNAVFRSGTARALVITIQIIEEEDNVAHRGDVIAIQIGWFEWRQWLAAMQDEIHHAHEIGEIITCRRSHVGIPQIAGETRPHMPAI